MVVLPGVQSGTFQWHSFLLASGRRIAYLPYFLCLDETVADVAFPLYYSERSTWRQAFRVNMLCEFTSAVTPSAVGGSSLIVLFLNKEGINAGRSTALTISCLFLDELFLVLACPFALLLFHSMICLVMWRFYLRE